MEKKKKRYFELDAVERFTALLQMDVQAEYDNILERLEREGCLVRPYGEKVEPGLFAIRVMQTANIRVFYVYGKDDIIYGIHAYVKKTQDIPQHELEQARKVEKAVRKGGRI